MSETREVTVKIDQMFTLPLTTTNSRLTRLTTESSGSNCECIFLLYDMIINHEDIHAFYK